MKILERYTRWALLGAVLLFGSVFVSCRKDSPPGPKANRNTLLMYVVGDNSISSDMQRSVNLVISRMDPKYLADNTVLIYVDANAYSGRSALPQLLEVVVDTEGKSTSRVVAEYEEKNSADAAILGEMIAIMRRDYPATERYGLMISSHGSGWLPGDFLTLLRSSRAVGQDGKNWIEIDALAEAIPNDLFEYILFDDCFMGAVEVAYALRNDADYLIATPTELWGDGMPYAALGPCFFGARPDPEAFCDALYEEYDDPRLGSTVSLIETARMDELAVLLRGVFHGKENLIYALNVSDGSRFQSLGSGSYKDVIFDLGDFVKAIEPTRAPEFEALLKQVVTYSRHSRYVTFPKGFTRWEINRFCGLSTYIPQTRYSVLSVIYNDTPWAKAIYQ